MYMDPGTGSMVLQILLGGVAGIAVAVRLFWHRLARLFGRKDAEAAEPPPAARDGE
jgi:hypothetical protein